MKKPTARAAKAYPHRLGRPLHPKALAKLSPEDTPWYQNDATVQARLHWGRKKARLLEWVRSQMMLRLTVAERRCIQLYYFEGLNYRQAAARLGVNPSTVYRGVQRGLRKLRQAARENPHLRL